MKRNDVILISSVAAYSFLFYRQSAGINFVLFNLVLTALLLIRDHTLVKSRAWLLAAAGSLLSAFCIGWYSTTLAVTANIISLCLLSALGFSRRSSVVLGILFSAYSVLSAPVFMILDRAQRRKNETLSERLPSGKIWLVVIPVLITVFFLLLYRASNPLFNELTMKISFDFISIGFIFFTLGGLCLMYAFFYHRQVKSLAAAEEGSSGNLAPSDPEDAVFLGKRISIQDEVFSGKVLFLLLNMLVLVVNILDLNFFFNGMKLPEGVGLSGFVHQGINALITSIVFAIMIILFYFRGGMNFYGDNKMIKWLAYLWIIQNAFMLFSTAFRNYMYVDEMGLTYKRIGVYVYLLLTVIGLVTTIVKIARVKSNYFLFRINGWIFYGLLVISCFFSWDTIITDYNVKHAASLEKNYLLRLSDSNLPQLFVIHQVMNTSSKEVLIFPTETDFTYHVDEEPASTVFDRVISRRLYRFMEEHDQLGWKSWYADHTRVYNDLKKLDEEGMIKRVNLTGFGLYDIYYLNGMKNIRELSLSSNLIYRLESLPAFGSLERLDLSYNKLSNLRGIHKFGNLRYLDLSGNVIFDYKPLASLKHLTELYIDKSVTAEQYKWLKAHLPATRIERN